MGLDRHPHVEGVSGMSADNTFPPLTSAHHSVPDYDHECCLWCIVEGFVLCVAVWGVFWTEYLWAIECSFRKTNGDLLSVRLYLTKKNSLFRFHFPGAHPFSF